MDRKVVEIVRLLKNSLKITSSSIIEEESLIILMATRVLFRKVPKNQNPIEFV